MSRVSIVYVNTSDEDEARRIGRALIEARLAAAVNLVPGVWSVFRWQGEIQERTETLLILKTSTERVDAVAEMVRSMHGYDCPSVLAVPAEGGNPEYLAWVAEESSDWRKMT